MPSGRRPHERGLLVRRLARVHAGAAREQRAHGRRVAGAGAVHQRRLAAGQREVRVGAGRRAAATPSARCGSCRPDRAASRRDRSRRRPARRRAAAPRPSPGRRDAPPSAARCCRRPAPAARPRAAPAARAPPPHRRRATASTSGVCRRPRPQTRRPHTGRSPRSAAPSAQRSRLIPGRRAAGRRRGRCCRRACPSARRTDRAASGAGWPAGDRDSGCGARPSASPRRRR